MSSKRNKFRPGEHGVNVELDPNFLLTHALYMPDGETIVRSNMTLGQAIEAIAFAYIKAMKTEWGNKCNVARIEFKDGKFVVTFADSVENLTF
jgi:hypothetical protein